MRYSTAIAYSPEAYAVSGHQVAGRLTAGEGFLRAYMEYGSFDTFLCHTPAANSFKQFCEQSTSSNIRKLDIKHVLPHDEATLERAGILYRPDPLIARFAWQRFDAKAYCLTGITYTLAERLVMEQLFELAAAPVFEWDSIICISESGKKVIQNVLEESRKYFQWRFKAEPPPEPMLPTIPLGIDPRRFLQGEKRESVRSARRAALQLADGEVVVLFAGRLSFFTKSNPAPMFMGLQQCVTRSKVPLCLMLAGWFESETEERAFQSAAAALAPQVKIIWVKRPTAAELSEVYAAADIFVSLSDNIQETFGLTVVEAMASRLPVIVSDWDGYREIVQEGIQGFRIPTALPPRGSGEDVARAYLQNSINYTTYAGHVSLMASVSIPDFASALMKLVESEPLRRKFGDAGFERATKCYDWKFIIPQYEALWREQTSIRARVSSSPYRVSSSPRCPDPASAFAHFPTIQFDSDTEVRLGSGALDFEAMQKQFVTAFGQEARLPAAVVQNWLTLFKTNEQLKLRVLIESVDGGASSLVMRSIAHLLKFNVLKLATKATS